MLNKEELEKYYIVERLTDKQIADLINSSATTIKRWRGIFGIQGRPRGPNTGKSRFVVSDKNFSQFVSESISYREVLLKCGLKACGGAYDVIKRRIKNLNLDISHFRGQGWNGIKKRDCFPAVSLELLLIENSPVKDSNKFKKRLYKEGILEEKCVECGIAILWNNKPINLHLEHKNGIRSDNRIENLCILCPNCHSQTSTYCRSKSSLNKIQEEKKKESKIKQIDLNQNFCIDCNNLIHRRSSRCELCHIKNCKLTTKIEWCSDEDLVAMIKSTSRLAVSKILGVSETAIRKRLKSRNIIIPKKD